LERRQSFGLAKSFGTRPVMPDAHKIAKGILEGAVTSLAG
jgi:hypothetical protein